LESAAPRQIKLHFNLEGPYSGGLWTKEISSTSRMREGVWQMSEAKIKKKTKTEIRRDLIDQLDRKGIYGSHYLDLIEDYMALWDIKNKLIKDIRERGVSIKWTNGPINPETGEAAQWGYKKNDSIAELNKTNAHMLKILSELNLKASSAGMADDSDEEM